MEARNRFERSANRIAKNIRVEDGWTQEDINHVKTILEALEYCSKLEAAGAFDADPAPQC